MTGAARYRIGAPPAGTHAIAVRIDHDGRWVLHREKGDKARQGSHREARRGVDRDLRSKGAAMSRPEIAIERRSRCGAGRRRGSAVALACAVRRRSGCAPATAFADDDPAAGGALPPGVRLVSGQAAIVGGNTAGARERALDEAMRQAVEQALAEQLDAQTRAAQARAIKTLQGRARSFIKRYRTVDENEANGLYTIRIEAEVDDAALRRATERWTPCRRRPPVRRPRASVGVDDGDRERSGRRRRGADAGAGVERHPRAARRSRRSATRRARSRPPAAARCRWWRSCRPPSSTKGSCAAPGRRRCRVRSAPRSCRCRRGSRWSRRRRRRAPSPSARRRRAPIASSRAAAAVAPRLSPSGAGPASAPSDLRVLVLDLDVVEPSAIAPS